MIGNTLRIWKGSVFNLKILVIGGSYFLGRVFVMQAASEHEITVVNRGTYSMENFGVKQITGDRRNPATWNCCDGDYDVLVDFCAYCKGDVSFVINHLSGTVRQYIMISTVDVYEHGGDGLKSEDSPFEMREIAGEAGEYIKGKIALEQELISECTRREISYTILRPSILYGPFNYAPRESVYIQMIVQNHILPHITDAKARFQMVYVKDVADAIRKCLLNENAIGQVYNICNETPIDYHILFECLKEVADVPFQEILMTVNQATEQNVPLSFPVTAEETNLCAGAKSINDLGLNYTDLSDGMLKTYRAFKNVFVD